MPILSKRTVLVNPTQRSINQAKWSSAELSKRVSRCMQFTCGVLDIGGPIFQESTRMYSIRLDLIAIHCCGPQGGEPVEVLGQNHPVRLGPLCFGLQAERNGVSLREAINVLSGQPIFSGLGITSKRLKKTGFGCLACFNEIRSRNVSFFLSTCSSNASSWFSTSTHGNIPASAGVSWISLLFPLR